jgi:hypothetical protein
MPFGASRGVWPQLTHTPSPFLTERLQRAPTALAGWRKRLVRHAGPRCGGERASGERPPVILDLAAKYRCRRSVGACRTGAASGWQE